MDVDTLHVTGGVTSLSWVGTRMPPVPLWTDEVAETPALVHTLRARIEVRAGQIVLAEYVPAAPELDGPVQVHRREPIVGPAQAFFAQTVGTRGTTPGTPLVWTTLELVVRADGKAYGVLVDASSDGRHAGYDQTGAISGFGGAPESRFVAPWLLRAAT